VSTGQAWLIGGKVSFSVSRINQYLNYYFVVFWVFVAVYVALRFVAPPDWPGWMSSIYVLFVAVIILVGVVFLLAQTTNTRRATLPQANGSHSNEEIKRDWEWCPHWRRPDLRKHLHGAGGADSQIFIRRCAPDEPNPSNRAD
jgi:hypothetical protein